MTLDEFVKGKVSGNSTPASGSSGAGQSNGGSTGGVTLNDFVRSKVTGQPYKSSNTDEVVKALAGKRLDFKGQQAEAAERYNPYSSDLNIARVERQQDIIRNSPGADDPLAKRGLAELEKEKFKYENPDEYSRQEQERLKKVNEQNLLKLQNQKNDLTGKRQEAEVGLAMAYTPEMQAESQKYIDDIDAQLASIDEQIASFEQPAEEKRSPFNADPRARVDANTVVNVRNQLAQVNSQINELQTGAAMNAMSGTDTTEADAQIAQLEQQRDYLNGQLKRYEATLNPQFEYINQQIAELTNKFMNAEGDERNEIGAQLEFLNIMQNELMKGLNISERPLVEWDGRQELVDEFKRLSRAEGSNPVTARRLQEVRRLLEEGDTLAGNGVRSYSTADAIGNFLQGGAERVGSSLSNAFATWFDAYSRGMSQQYTLGNALTDQAFGIDPMSRIEMQTADYMSEESQALRQRMYDTADRIGANATEDLERVKRGMSEAGKVGVDIAENVLEMGFDAGVGAMTGGGSLPSMFIRVFGSSAQEARQNGASLNEQMAYGLTKAGIEVATEKMFDGVAKIYGAGAADEITEKLIGKLADTDTGRTLLRLIIGAQGEGVEEVVSDLLDPLAKSIYSDKSVAELYSEVDPADILYSYLIGTAVGVIGGGTNIVTGGNAAANYQLRQNEAGIGVDASTDNAWEALTGRSSSYIDADGNLQEVTAADRVNERERKARNALGLDEETGLPPVAPAEEAEEVPLDRTLRPSQIVRNAEQRAAFEKAYPGVLNENMSATEAEKAVSQALRERATEETVAEETPTETPAEAPAEAPQNDYTEAEYSVIDILTNPNGVKPTDAKRIIDSPQLREAFSALFPDIDMEQSRGKLTDAIRNADVGTIEDNAPAVNNAPTVNTPAVTETENAPAVDNTEEAPAVEERTLTKAQQGIVETLQKGEALTDAEIDTILESDAKLDALVKLGMDEPTGSNRARRSAVRAFAQDIINNGVPETKTVAKIRQDADIASTEQEITYRLEQMEEERDAAIKQGDIEKRKAIARERRELKRKQSISRISKAADTLGKTLKSPTASKYVPTELATATGDFIAALNEARVDRTSDSKKAQNAAAKFDKLASEFAKLKDAQSKIGNDIETGVGYDADVAAWMEECRKMFAETPLNEMDTEQLEYVQNTLKAMNKAIANGRTVKIRGEKRIASDLMQKMRKETEAARGGDSIGDKYVDMMTRPETFFNKMAGWVKDSAWHLMYEVLNNGQKKAMRLRLDAQDMFSDLIKQSKNYKTLRDEVELKGLKDADGNTVKISRGMMLSLYLHLLNEQNTNHIAGGGLTIADISDYYHKRHDNGFGVNSKSAVGMSQEMNTLKFEYDQAKKRGDTEAMDSIREEMEDLRESEAARIEGLRSEIENQLTDYERDFITRSQEFFSWAQNELNLTTEDVYGFLKATVENYFPIKADSNYRGAVAEEQGAATNKTLENTGIVMNRTNSNAPIMLMDITDVLDGYIKQMSQYCGLMPAIKAFNQVYHSQLAGHKGNLGGAMDSKFGKGAQKYIKNLLDDLQGTRSSGGGGILDSVLSTARGNFAASVLTLNLRVAGSQAASWFNAAPVVGVKNLLASVPTKNEDLNLIRQYSPLLAARTNGKNTYKFSDNNLDLASQRDRITRKFGLALNWINNVDNFTVRRLWNAAEKYVQGSSDFAKGSEDYYKEVGRVFDEIIERTQPNYEVMQRPDILRNPDKLARAVTMFATQRLQNFNEVYDRIQQARKYAADYEAGINGVTEADVREANKAAALSVAGAVTSSIALTLMKGVVDAILHRTKNYRDDETGELTNKSVLLRIMDYTAESLMSNVIGGAELYQLTKAAVTGGKYYGTSVPGVDTISDMVTDILGAFRASEKTRGDAILKAAGSVATLFGIPFDNAKGYVEAAINWGKGFEAGTWYESDFEYTSAQNKQIAYDALLGDVDPWLERRVIPDDNAYDLAMERMGDNAEKNVTDAIKDNYNDGNIDFTTANGMLQKLGLTEKEADDKILEWDANDVYGNNLAAWEKREDRGVNNLDRDLRKARESKEFQNLDEDAQKEVLGDIYNFHKHLEKKRFAEANDIEYENEAFEKYADLDDPVERMILENRLNPALKKDKKDPSVIADPDAVDALIGEYLDGNMTEEDKEWFEAHDYAKDLIAGAELDKPIGAEDYFDILAFVNQMSKWNTEAKKGPEQRDEEMIDSTLALIAPLLESDDARAIFNDSYAWTDELLDAREIGMGSELFFKYFDQYNVMKDDKSLSADDAYNKMYKIVEDADDLTREQKEFLHDRFPWTRFVPVRDTTFEKMVDRGMDTDYAEKYVSSWAELTEKKRAEKNDPDATLSATEKARVIWSDTTLSVNDRLQMLDYSNILPSQHDFAVWLSTSGLPKSEIYRWWSIIGAKNTPKPWATSYDQALKKKK